ncbi:hypothetical protein HYW74_04845 [Candidatus Pacearchaeota archaeon]|nr:hypothetical protein [Candidatus Pacearchaeota archaeon]
MSKILGYILSLVGIAILSLTVKPVKETTIVKTILPFIGSINDLYVIIAGFAVIIVAILLLRGSGGGKQAKEVPIYHGKNVVGYRRLGKK